MRLKQGCLNVSCLTVLGAFLYAVFSLGPVACAASRVVDVQVTDRGFSPTNILANLNQPVELHVTNSGQHGHQFSIPYYRIYSRELNPGDSTDIQFSPWTAGHFEMMSDPSGDNQPEFVGQFIVTPKR